MGAGAAGRSRAPPSPPIRRPARSGPSDATARPRGAGRRGGEPCPGIGSGDAGEGAVEVGDDVVDALQAHREPDHVVPGPRRLREGGRGSEGARGEGKPLNSRFVKSRH